MNSQDKIYKITEYKSEEKMLTRSEYLNYLQRKLSYYFDKVEEAKLKSIKVSTLLKEENDKMQEILNKMSDLGENDQDIEKYLEYKRWSYSERYPKKYKILKDNYMGYK